MATFTFEREWFFPKEKDGNLSFATMDSRISEAIALLNQGDCIVLEDGTKCKTPEELKNALGDIL